MALRHEATAIAASDHDLHRVGLISPDFWINCKSEIGL